MMLNIEKKIVFNEIMKKHTSFKIGGCADMFLVVNSKNEVKQAIQFSKVKNIPLYVIGNGSNLLITDNGIRGLVLKIDINNLEIFEEENGYVKVIVGAGFKMMALGQLLAKKGITGFEELSGIPGTIGGAIFMNAGAYGKEMKDIVLETKIMDEDGNIHVISNKEHQFSYRKSIFNDKKWIILETIFLLKKADSFEITSKMKKLFEERKIKQPLEYPSAGSSFKRKEGVIVSKLIDECGLKGYSVGGAEISVKHAGFIVNKDNATSNDVIKLIEYVKKKVYEEFNIEIEEEIKILGEK